MCVIWRECAYARPPERGLAPSLPNLGLFDGLAATGEGVIAMADPREFDFDLAAAEIISAAIIRILRLKGICTVGELHDAMRVVNIEMKQRNDIRAEARASSKHHRN